MTEILNLDFLLLVVFTSICFMFAIRLYSVWKILTVIYIVLGIFISVFVDFYIHSYGGQTE